MKQVFIQIMSQIKNDLLLLTCCLNLTGKWMKTLNDKSGIIVLAIIIVDAKHRFHFNCKSEN